MSILKELQCSDPECPTVTHSDGIQTTDGWVLEVAEEHDAPGVKIGEKVWVGEETGETDADGFPEVRKVLAMCDECGAKMKRAISAPNLGGFTRKSVGASAGRSARRAVAERPADELRGLLLKPIDGNDAFVDQNGGRHEFVEGRVGALITPDGERHSVPVAIIRNEAGDDLPYVPGKITCSGHAGCPSCSSSKTSDDGTKAN